jgi:hypothetical protein
MFSASTAQPARASPPKMTKPSSAHEEPRQPEPGAPARRHQSPVGDQRQRRHQPRNGRDPRDFPQGGGKFRSDSGQGKPGESSQTGKYRRTQQQPPDRIARSLSRNQGPDAGKCKGPEQVQFRVCPSPWLPRSRSRSTQSLQPVRSREPTHPPTTRVEVTISRWLALRPNRHRAGLSDGAPRPHRSGEDEPRGKRTRRAGCCQGQHCRVARATSMPSMAASSLPLPRSTRI